MHEKNQVSRLYYKALLSTEMYLMMSNTCYGNNTVFNQEDIDSANSGITCFRKGSMSTTGILKKPNGGGTVNCGNGFVQCKLVSGFLILFTQPDFPQSNDGKYTCCIDGSSISARIYTNNSYNAFLNLCELLEVKSTQIIIFYIITTFHYNYYSVPILAFPVIESCSITPPLDITVAPQQYIVNMITSMCLIKKILIVVLILESLEGQCVCSRYTEAPK